MPVPESYPTYVTVNDINRNEHIMLFGGPLPLEPGTRNVIALRVSQLTGPSATEFRGNMRADVFLRTSSTAPFDPASFLPSGGDVFRR